MKIAIQGHPTRGKEIIQILESLGGRNMYNFNGFGTFKYYIDSFNKINIAAYLTSDWKIYSLEEFEKEFPFKIGDKVTVITNTPYKIVALEYYMGKLSYKLDNGLNYNPKVLTPYKEMKEERNITLTLEKAQEWYNKGGELKEIALQAFTEKELTKLDLPKTWEEFCINYPVQTKECWLSERGRIEQPACSGSRRYKNWIPSRKSAEAHLALIQLEQLRDCYNNSCNDTNRIAIINNNGNIELYVNPPFNCFLTFKNHLLAREFFSNFKEIIEIAKKLI